MKKNLRCLVSMIFVFLVLFCTDMHVVKADENLAFEKNEFVFDKYFESTPLNMTIPTGFSLSDLKFYVEDEDIVQVRNYAAEMGDDDYGIAMSAENPGETTVKVTIEDTNYEAECKVKVINPITISWEKNEDKTVVSIQNKCAAWFLDTDYQAVEMKVISLEDNSESDWIRFDEAQFGKALNETYTYDVENNKNYKIMVRWLRGSPYTEGFWSEMGVENEVIIYGKESGEEPPTDIVDNAYDFFSNKEKIEINVGASDKVEITAKLKEGLNGIQAVKMAKDNWDVEWKIEDETIASCTTEKGIENNIYGITQIVGRSTIQGLKSGTTQLIVKVKVSESQVEEFKIPITVKIVNKNDDKKEDNTTADKKLAKTGETRILIIAGIASVIMLVHFGKKLRK